MKIEELRIVVTGAASGLGRQFSLSLAEEGARVVGLDVDEAKLGRLVAEAKERGLEIVPAVANVCKQDQVVAAVRAATAQLGSLNGLINCAGIYRDALLVKLAENSKVVKFPLAQWQTVLDVDLTGPFLMTREVVATMIEAGIRPGVVINISSVARAGFPGQSNYAAAKAGVVSNARVWAQELAPYGIRVVSLAPGFVQTPILAAMPPEVLAGWIAKVPLQRLGEPGEIYQGIRFAIECDYVNGTCLEIDGGLCALAAP